jgi:aryl-alcohol dehydrogenase-like predicted oxidoreductase
VPGAAPPETQGATERYIGSWLARPGNREQVLIATKAAGPSRKLVQARHLRGGNTRHDRANLEAALHDSLRRLGTDVIDLYQLHWPDRSTNHFGELGYRRGRRGQRAHPRNPHGAGRLCAGGQGAPHRLSNETPWGITRFLHHAETAAWRGW